MRTDISPKSPRKPKHIWAIRQQIKVAKRNLRLCQLLLGHRKLDSTVRYLGIAVDDALEISEQIDLCQQPGSLSGPAFVGFGWEADFRLETTDLGPHRLS